MQVISRTVLVLWLGLTVASLRSLAQSGGSQKEQKQPGGGGGQKDPRPKGPPRGPGANQAEGKNRKHWTGVQSAPNMKKGAASQALKGKPLGTGASAKSGQSGPKKYEYSKVVKEGQLKLDPPQNAALGKL